MKRVSVFEGIKSINQVKRILSNNYSDYSIDTMSREKWNFGDNKKQIVFIHLNYKADEFSSLKVYFNPNKETMEVKKDNGNKTIKWRELFEPVI